MNPGHLPSPPLRRGKQAGGYNISEITFESLLETRRLIPRGTVAARYERRDF
jgi:hypothetical protein